MVGRAFVAERGGDRRVDGEARLVGEGEAELGEGLGPFVAAMRHGPQIGDGEVAAAVGRVRGGRDGGGVGRPHRRGREGGRAERGGHLLDAGAELGQPGAVGPAVGEEQALGKAEAEIVPHLLQPLQRRRARVRDQALVGRRGDVAEAEARIIVARADDAVEIDLGERHLAAHGEEGVAGLRCRAGRRFRGRACAVSSAEIADVAAAGGEIARAGRWRASCSCPSTLSPTVSSTSSRDSRTVRTWSVGAVMVGPPSKMSI